MDKFINEMFPIKLLDIGVPTRNNHVYNINVANYIVETINNNKPYYVYSHLASFPVGQIIKAYIVQDMMIYVDVKFFDTVDGRRYCDIGENALDILEGYPCGNGYVSEKGIVSDYRLDFVVLTVN